MRYRNARIVTEITPVRYDQTTKCTPVKNELRLVMTKYGATTKSIPVALRKVKTAWNNPRLASSIAWKKTKKAWIKFIDSRTYVHFLHVGKTGGTAIKTAFRRGAQDSAYGLQTPSHRIFLHEHHVSLSDVPKGEKFFFFLRDPIDRFVSGFYSRKRKGKPMYRSPWSEDEELAFSRFETPNELALSLSSSGTKERKAAFHAMRSIEHVGDSYSKWYESTDYFLTRLSDALMIGRVEELNSYFSKLRDILNLAPRTKLPTSDQKAHRNPYSELDTHLEEEARRNLENWYSEDYAFLKLCKKVGDQISYQPV